MCPRQQLLAALGATWVFAVVGAVPVQAHCDSMDGPVVKDAMTALSTKTVKPVLKWVAAEKEAEIRGLFEEALAVRELGPQARRLADRAFLEALVRIHREGEGAPYTGLKPAGGAGPAATATDEALVKGSAGELVRMTTAEVERGLRERFARAAAARRRADESVELGREYVAAYVELVHYAERMYAGTTAEAHGHAAESEAPAPGHGRHP